MKRTTIIVLGILIAILTVGRAGAVHAERAYQAGDTVTVAAGEMIDHALFAAGQTVDIAGTINGDVFCAGQTVTISGTVNGDVYCAGQVLTVSGHINGSIHLAGQSTLLSGTVTQDAAVAAQNFNSENRTVIQGDANLAGQ